ncbi:hypothetical protein M9H77_12834 [Catharanthus roseus]|uniref:Uncharacterized protein n=1 Tax=Catharanthus roseus TaxID=4058 RepID=A0ACC0BIG1_CATRO|nr:hypothetical protein M9H77_12834 [Catharanthus roseus]
MVKVKNANVGMGENYEEGRSSRDGRTGKEKGKKVASKVRLPKSERRFEELFTKGEVLKRHDGRNVNKLDAYGRLLYHMISNIIIPNVDHKSSITNRHSFVMLALHEHRRMNIRFMVIEHMLATQTSSTNFPILMLNLIGVDNHIGIGKIYNKHTFKRMGFSRNKEGMLVREEQENDDESDEEEEEDKSQEAMNVDEELCKKNKRCTKEISRMIYKEAKDHSRLQRLYEDEVIKLKTLKFRRMARDSFKRKRKPVI